MEYIEGNTMTIAQAKYPENRRKIATAIRIAHSTTKNPFFKEDSSETAESVYQAIREQVLSRADLDEAEHLMGECTEKLEKICAPKVNIHGDLNPKNIFIN